MGERSPETAQVASGDHNEIAEELHGLRFRVEVACEGWANLFNSDVPSDTEVEDYIRGAHDAAEAIRTALMGEAEWGQS